MTVDLLHKWVLRRMRGVHEQPRAVLPFSANGSACNLVFRTAARTGAHGARVLALPPGRGLQAASASERDGPNHWPVGLPTVKRHKCRAPSGLQIGGIVKMRPLMQSDQIFLFNHNGRC